MNLIFGRQPLPAALDRNPRGSRYADLYRALAARPGEWIGLGSTDIKGSNTKQKRHTLLSSATTRKLSVEVVVDGDVEIPEPTEVTVRRYLQGPWPQN